MNPIPPVKIEVDADHSCNNWKCCYGCRCVKKNKEDSPVSMEIVERVTRTYEIHHHSHSSNPEVVSKILPSPKLEDAKDDKKG